MKNFFCNKGFTLIELMTVVTIITILAAIALPNFLNAIIRAKVSRSQAEQELIVWALESYFVDQDEYPSNQDSMKMSLGDLVPITTPVAYISVLPEDIFLAPAERDKSEFINQERHGIKTYFYLNFIQATGNRISLSPYGREGSANYLIYGLGPAFTLGYEPDNPETLIVYDPSNGTSSQGYIATFGP